MSGPDSFRSARPEDYDDIDLLLRTAFAGDEEVRLMRDLRAAGLIETEVVMPWSSGIVAHLALSRLVAPVGWLALAPVCVTPEWQGKRLGSRMLAGVMRLAAIKQQAVVVVGKPSFYARAGFRFGGVASRYPVEVVGAFGAEPVGDVIYPLAFDGV